MRIALAALVLFASSGVRAADDKPPPEHHHRHLFYSGWSLVGVGGVSTLLGAALTTREDSASSTAGWVLAGVGTATWIGGALILRFAEKAKRY